MRYYVTIFLAAIVSAATYFSISTPHVSDFFYSLRPAIAKDKICLNQHFYTLDKQLPSLSDEISLIYSYDMEKSRDIESAYFRLKDHLGFFNYTRYPAVLDLDTNEPATWGEVLTQTRLDARNPELILKSYDVFLDSGDASRRAFDKELIQSNITPYIFHRTILENDFGKDLRENLNLIADIKPKALPSILVKGEYVVYPASFEDVRDAWMIADFLYSNEPGQGYAHCQ